MVLSNKILWNNEMALAICLRSELDQDEFEVEALNTHLELTGDELIKGEYIIHEQSMIRVLEVV